MPGRARASAASDRRFIFVQALGGWDPARVFAPVFGSDTVVMEDDATEGVVGDISFVDHPDRPSVRAFLENFGSSSVVLNGVYVPSISHSSAIRLMLTGGVSALHADWGTRIATAHAAEHVIPFLVAGGFTFSGAYGVHVGRAGLAGQIRGLATAEILDQSDVPVTAPSAASASIVDAWLLDAAGRRSADRAALSRRASLETYQIALDRAARLKVIAQDVDLSTDTSFEGQAALALRALSAGISRCVTIAYPASDINVAWDSHTETDLRQSELYEGLFASLDLLMADLAATRSPTGAWLSEETVVIVLSEMGRTPFYNNSGGKDHWPYTSAMLMGAGLLGGQVVGGFDNGLIGAKVDLETGAVDEGGLAIGNDTIGATLLALAGLDPEAEGLDAIPLSAVIA